MKILLVLFLMFSCYNNDKELDKKDITFNTNPIVLQEPAKSIAGTTWKYTFTSSVPDQNATHTIVFSNDFKTLTLTLYPTSVNTYNISIVGNDIHYLVNGNTAYIINGALIENGIARIVYKGFFSDNHYRVYYLEK